MSEEAATPGGLNAQSVALLKTTPHYDNLTQVQYHPLYNVLIILLLYCCLLWYSHLFCIVSWRGVDQTAGKID